MSGIRAVSATLLGLDQQHRATVRVIIDRELPDVIMFDGEPFILDRVWVDPVSYHQLRPYRIDAGEEEPVE